MWRLGARLVLSCCYHHYVKGDTVVPVYQQGWKMLLGLALGLRSSEERLALEWPGLDLRFHWWCYNQCNDSHAQMVLCMFSRTDACARLARKDHFSTALKSIAHCLFPRCISPKDWHCKCDNWGYCSCIMLRHVLVFPLLSKMHLPWRSSNLYMHSWEATLPREAQVTSKKYVSLVTAVFQRFKFSKTLSPLCNSIFFFPLCFFYRLLF